MHKQCDHIQNGLKYKADKLMSRFMKRESNLKILISTKESNNKSTVHCGVSSDDDSLPVPCLKNLSANSGAVK